ncbi:uncharacterized protein LOC111309904 isoform X2 [Durio zibethinus]|uniref:Uncharacterized protein LOC111309904 isoform X2 n=1 Tax=Durio zibethinus TaxID=66656 RepID=A0A6P6AIM0_DURZI|nr:uncharacterized protein LOC111309904 isoform X2 [Durio zibethinus]
MHLVFSLQIASSISYIIITCLKCIWLCPLIQDPIAKLFIESPPKNLPDSKGMATGSINIQSNCKQSQREKSAIAQLQRRLGISVSLSGPGLQIIDESEDKEFIELGSSLIGVKVSNNEQDLLTQTIKVLRDQWRKSKPSSIPLKELGPLLGDYQRLITSSSK